jgi:DNA-binding response OmpR family regulator
MKRHLLVASASGAVAGRIEQLFSHRGYRVDVVEGGVECLAKIQRMAPDALILDWDLPWGGGAGVLACLRETDATANRPVILLAGRFARGVDSDAPVAWCLRKPLDMGLLYDAVDAELDSIESGSGDARIREQQAHFQSVSH